MAEQASGSTSTGTVPAIESTSNRTGPVVHAGVLHQFNVFGGLGDGRNSDVALSSAGGAPVQPVLTAPIQVNAMTGMSNCTITQQTSSEVNSGTQIQAEADRQRCDDACGTGRAVVACGDGHSGTPSFSAPGSDKASGAGHRVMHSAADHGQANEQGSGDASSASVLVKNGKIVCPNDLFPTKKEKITLEHCKKWFQYYPYMSDDTIVRERAMSGEHPVYNPGDNEKWQKILLEYWGHIRRMGAMGFEAWIVNHFRERGLMYHNQQPQTIDDCVGLIKSSPVKAVSKKDPLFIFKATNDVIHCPDSNALLEHMMTFLEGLPFTFSPKVGNSNSESRKTHEQHNVMKIAKQGVSNIKAKMKRAEQTGQGMSIRRRKPSMAKGDETKEDRHHYVRVRWDQDGGESRGGGYLKVPKDKCWPGLKPDSVTAEELETHLINHADDVTSSLNEAVALAIKSGMNLPDLTAKLTLAYQTLGGSIVGTRAPPLQPGRHQFVSTLAQNQAPSHSHSQCSDNVALDSSLDISIDDPLWNPADELGEVIDDESSKHDGTKGSADGGVDQGMLSHRNVNEEGHSLSEYELFCKEKRQRNEAYMHMLGLVPKEPVAKSAAKVSGKKKRRSCPNQDATRRIQPKRKASVDSKAPVLPPQSGGNNKGATVLPPQSGGNNKGATDSSPSIYTPGTGSDEVVVVGTLKGNDEESNKGATDSSPSIYTPGTGSDEDVCVGTLTGNGEESDDVVVIGNNDTDESQEEEKNWRVVRIDGTRRRKGVKQYLCKWKGAKVNYDTFEGAAVIKRYNGDDSIIKEYEKRCSEKKRGAKRKKEVILYHMTLLITGPGLNSSVSVCLLCCGNSQGANEIADALLCGQGLSQLTFYAFGTLRRDLERAVGR